jgi:hypothetical protein
LIGRSQPIVGSSSESKNVYVASNDIIRIVTPFENPRVVTISDADIERSQHVLYVLLEGDEEVSMFVTDAQNEARSISLTLKPRDDGVREINVASTSSTAIRAASSPSKPTKRGQLETPKAVGKSPDPWDPTCLFCRAKQDNGNDVYDGDSWE